MARLQQRISEPMQAQLDMINHGARLLATDRSTIRSVERGGEDYQILLKSLGILRFRYRIDLTEDPAFTSVFHIP